MGLYDQVKMADSPYMSQYVGSIVPEIANYSNLVQTRYNDAADSDDKLSEALSNLQHLGLAGDTQYANELKQQYYQKLQDRSDRGDYENMGRRTHRDAMNFVGQYQPLLQRQTDYAAIVKRVNGDANIADPEKKAQILEYIQHLNQTPVDPTTGGFVRDAAGRVQLGGIQDWQYAKDVDVNKKLSDLLAKKEADINQSKFTSVNGYRVSTKEELRSPKVMAMLANEIQQTDPEIKAMISRDVTLQNYKLTDDQISQGLKQSAMSPYQRLRQKGLSDHDITVQARAAGMSLDDAKVSPVARQVQRMVASGMSEAAANKAVYNELTAQSMRDPSNSLMGDLFSVHKITQEEHTDEWALMKARHALEQMDKFNGDYQLIKNPALMTQDLDPVHITDTYVQKQKAATGMQQSLQASIQAALTKAGMASGDPKKDLVMSQMFTEDGTKLTQLVDKIKATNPDLADRLQTAGNTYYQAKSELASHKANTLGLEEASGVDTHKLYDAYVKRSKESPTGGPPIDYNRFLNSIRSADLNPEDRSDNSILTKAKNLALYPGLPTPIEEARHAYTNKVKGTVGSLGFMAALAGQGVVGDTKGMLETISSAQGGFTKYKTAMPGYTSIAPMNDADGFGKVANFVKDQAQGLSLQLKDISQPGSSPMNLAKLIGADNTTTKGKEAIKDTKILINQEPAPDGKISATVYLPDGSQKVVAIDNLDPTTAREIKTRMVEVSGLGADKQYVTSRQQKAIAGMGDDYFKYMSTIDLENRQPSSVVYPVNDQYAIKIKPGGSEGKRYEIYSRNPVTGDNEPTGIVKNSVDDVRILFGKDNFQKNASPKVQERVSKQ